MRLGDLDGITPDWESPMAVDRQVETRVTRDHAPIGDAARARKVTRREAQPGRLAPQRTAAERLPSDPTVAANVIDRCTHAATARLTLGLSPASLGAAYLDWAVHLATSPGKQVALLHEAALAGVQLARSAIECCTTLSSPATCVEPSPYDKRFAGPAWQQWPYNLLAQAFLFARNNGGSRRRPAFAVCQSITKTS
jgi:polyhydroxyalkanoate synthase subunit PhaC